MTDMAVRVQPSAPGEPAKAAKPLRPRKISWGRAIRRDWQIYSLAILPLAFFAVFRYAPMIGSVLAFRHFKIGSMFGDRWVGLRYFKFFITDQTFWQVFTNTLVLGILTLLVTFPLPIVLALLLNEVRNQPIKRFVQSVSYLPHFLSIVIVVAMIQQFVAADGLVNQIVQDLGHDKILFIQESDWFRTIFVTSEVWQTVGFGTILYLAALTTIDDQLYEAARIDGAGRWRQTWHITLPGIRPTMVVVLLLNLGTVLGVSFEKVLLLQVPLTYETSDIISTYLYRLGLTLGQVSLATAIGLFEAVIGLVLISSANFVARRTVGSGLW
jgi:putative aldouronate transport system permease protein